MVQVKYFKPSKLSKQKGSLLFKKLLKSDKKIPYVNQNNYIKYLKKLKTNNTYEDNIEFVQEVHNMNSLNVYVNQLLQQKIKKEKDCGSVNINKNLKWEQTMSFCEMAKYFSSNVNNKYMYLTNFSVYGNTESDLYYEAEKTLNTSNDYNYTRYKLRINDDDKNHTFSMYFSENSLCFLCGIGSDKKYKSSITPKNKEDIVIYGYIIKTYDTDTFKIVLY
jgi:hypothetical protein